MPNEDIPSGVQAQADAIAVYVGKILGIALERVPYYTLDTRVVVAKAELIKALAAGTVSFPEK